MMNMKSFRRTLPLLFVATAIGAHAQYAKTHGLSWSVGGTGQFSSLLESSPATTTNLVPFSGGGLVAETVTNKQQYTTDSAGFVTSAQFHPVAWAGVEFNYGFTHYSERYAYSYSTVPGTRQTSSIPVDAHEATGAYQFHPKHIPFQPFVNIGGGAIDFAPRNAANQWRGAGLLEVGFDVPTHSRHIGFRVEGRSLYYRSPNFNSSALSTRSWRATEEPSVSTYYRF
jgi:hypothetical protein